MPTLDDRFQRHQRQLSTHGQEHLLAFWPTLKESQRVQLLDDLEALDLELCRTLIDTHVRNRPAIHLPTQIEPPPSYPVVPTADLVGLYDRARAKGEEAIATGRVAAFTVAGGQGTRLGFDGPKGAFPTTPIRNAPLFQVFAEGLLGIERRYGRRPRWYIMTSPANHTDTVAFFEQHRYFGLSSYDVMFFQQGQMPAFLPDGRIALAERHRVALSPDGHGGSLRALAERGALADMRARGIEFISYFQVDNPLVRVIDPLFVGLHIDTGSEMSSKAIAKAFDTERVGNFCLVDGRITVIEYSDLPEELATARNTDGSRRFDAGSIAIHILSRTFVERLTAPGATVQLPWHRAEKKVPTIDAEGHPVQPAEPNAIKLEMFVFDAIPLAAQPLVLYTARAEEFSPVKNAEGIDSAVTARRDQIRRAAAWLSAAGVTVPRDAAGEPAMPLEISTQRALDAEDLRAVLRTPPRLLPGMPWLLD
ncbi:MAG: UDPGP type 1 family protein [Phycisphaerales bacterium]|nr:UDPGP type 1 family protein [Phycisphaerales bacterium]